MWIENLQMYMYWLHFRFNIGLIIACTTLCILYVIKFPLNIGVIAQHAITVRRGRCAFITQKQYLIKSYNLQMHLTNAKLRLTNVISGY